MDRYQEEIRRVAAKSGIVVGNNIARWVGISVQFPKLSLRGLKSRITYQTWSAEFFCFNWRPNLSNECVVINRGNILKRLLNSTGGFPTAATSPRTDRPPPRPPSRPSPLLHQPPLAA